MIQFTYELSKDDGIEKYNQVIDELQKLFLPDCFMRYMEVFDVLCGFTRRRFDILDKEMYTQPGITSWQEKVSDIHKMKKDI